MSDKDKSEIIVAEGFKISKPWMNFILYVQTTYPEADLTVKFAAGAPVELLGAKPKVRFDKGEPPIGAGVKFG